MKAKAEDDFAAGIDYCIGIDCGATSAKLKAYSSDGALLYDDKAGAANFATDFATASENVKKLLERLFANKKFPISSCKNCVIGAAGIESGENKENLRKVIKKFFPEIEPLEIMTDAQLAHIAKLEGEKGILVISGTGSVVIDNLKDDWKITGGWGYLLGDEGSGHWLGLKALRQCMNEIDAGESSSEQSKSIYKKIGIKEGDRAGVLQFAYSASRADIASLSVAVTNEKILALAGMELAYQVLQAAFHAKSFDSKIAINGSVIEKNKAVYSSFEKSINSVNKSYKIVKSENPAEKAAVYSIISG
jgi:N-acetylglucosamine kinase-like BadF-type ATPase